MLIRKSSQNTTQSKQLNKSKTLYVSILTNSYLEWELVKRVDFLQVIQDEVE